MAIKDKDSSNQQPTLQELLDYRAGKLEGKARHKVEKFLLENELASDAFEGFDEFGDDGKIQDITDQLNQKIANRAKQQPKLVAWYRKPVFSIAASLLLLFTITSVFIWQLNNGTNELAMELSSQEEATDLADQVFENEDDEIPTASSAESQTNTITTEEAKPLLKKEKEFKADRQLKPQAAPPSIPLDEVEIEEETEIEMIEVEVDDEELEEEIIQPQPYETGAGIASDADAPQTIMDSSNLVAIRKVESEDVKRLEGVNSKGRSLSRTKKTLKRSPKTLKKAKNLFVDGKYIEAALACDKVLEDDSFNTDALILSGLSYLKGGIYDTAKTKLAVVKTFTPPVLPKEELEQVLQLIDDEKYEDATHLLQQIMPKGFLD